VYEWVSVISNPKYYPRPIANSTARERWKAPVTGSEKSLKPKGYRIGAAFRSCTVRFEQRSGDCILVASLVRRGRGEAKAISAQFTRRDLRSGGVTRIWPEAWRAKPEQDEAAVKGGGGLKRFYIYVFFWLRFRSEKLIESGNSWFPSRYATV